MAGMMARVASGVVVGPNSPKLLIGTGADQTHLLVVVTSDRGLCGGFNGNLVRRVRHEVRKLQAEGKAVKLLCVGRKGRDVLKREYSALITHSFTGLAGRTDLSFAEADEVSQWILEQFGAGAFDVCTLVYNEFVSVLTQKPTFQQLIPFKASEGSASNDNRHLDKSSAVVVANSPSSFEPEEDQILGALLPKNLAIPIYRSLLDSGAGEQAARMTAMDNATRNAGDMINKLSIQYNRARQAFITKELIEIISGAEAAV
jgi:F-type H+-transporting ATPase subunit gamma